MTMNTLLFTFGLLFALIADETIGMTDENFDSWSMTESEFLKCASAVGRGTPSVDVAQAFIKLAAIRGGITSKLEAFMAVTQLAWQSKGFTISSEPVCKVTSWWPCDSYDRLGCPPGNLYFGRGYIQMKHCYNYRAASKEFPGIVENPELVAEREDYAIGTALWFWKNRVSNVTDVQRGYFGATTRAIVGDQECEPDGSSIKGRHRYHAFKACLGATGYLSLKPKEEGCYRLSPKASAVKQQDLYPQSDGQKKVCRHASGNSQYDDWCVANCANDHCPKKLCFCK